MLTRRKFAVGAAGAVLAGATGVNAATLADANSSEVPASLPADVCIIGAGAAGLTIATRLAHHGRSSVLIESGGDAFDATTQQLYHAAVAGLPYLPQESRLRFFGGSTNHWSGWCRPVDLDSIPNVDCPPWPITSSELTTYFDVAHEYCQIGPSSWRAVDWLPQLAAPPHLRETLTVVDHEDIASHVWQYSNPPVNFGSRFRRELLASPYVRLLTNLNLVSATFDGRQVTALQCRTLQGKQVTIAPREVVLCCGGIENARILLTLNREGSRQPGNDRDLVGRYFTDHVIPHTIADVIPTTGNFAYYADQWNSTIIPNHSATSLAVRALFALTTAAAARLGVPHIIARLEPPAPIDASEAVLLEYAQSAIKHDHALNGRPVPRNPVRMALVMLLTHRPEWSSRVSVKLGQRDPLGVPKAALSWQVQEEDMQTLARFAKTLGEILAAQGTGRVWWRAPTDQGLADLVRAGAWVGNHHMCTTRMADDPQAGVVNPDLLVFGTSNLYVCGSSVFPHAGAATPTLTIVALAARLAAHLAGRT